MPISILYVMLALLVFVNICVLIALVVVLVRRSAHRMQIRERVANGLDGTAGQTAVVTLAQHYPSLIVGDYRHQGEAVIFNGGSGVGGITDGNAIPNAADERMARQQIHPLTTDDVSLLHQLAVEGMVVSPTNQMTNSALTETRHFPSWGLSNRIAVPLPALLLAADEPNAIPFLEGEQQWDEEESSSPAGWTTGTDPQHAGGALSSCFPPTARGGSRDESHIVYGRSCYFVGPHWDGPRGEVPLECVLRDGCAGSSSESSSDISSVATEPARCIVANRCAPPTMLSSFPLSLYPFSFSFPSHMHLSVSSSNSLFASDEEEGEEYAAG
ncbi:T. brucei spp.-specific protein [Trypanosoma brucei gambiense DAL972]|uniref:T. brucei spp.-specific protein n=1 Tax=Trypanosoma brucei gambiense (strain MHOM/CI/86/DAL972) TaxID=679716 RepID=C9ZMC3_TRYB9|nr:T. brucei spp.-specific protein [Trypanosoma brucei gambiense DAL972]CBH10796.1 T. brucei spp.-specific protein [Trypanosoma brucei gambiense DAL972]|eukprot:XP_011773084.1 T. brucei spp.-specific protein [Trypanosoma brucei gambiense DAL972]